MGERISILINNWTKRNITGFYCNNKTEAADKILEMIPVSASIGISGSRTLDELEIVKTLESRGNQVFNQYKPGISREENLRLRRSGANADFYLASPNAISQAGELVFFSGYGNRTTGVSYAQNVILVAGINKVTPNLEQAIKRAREYATPLNCKRLNCASACLKDGICRQDICFVPEYRRMCCQILILEAEYVLDRLRVILVNENLGF